MAQNTPLHVGRKRPSFECHHMASIYHKHENQTGIRQHISGSAHWSPISLVPHLIGPFLIGPPSHWSPSHWSPISLVPHLIGPPFHLSPHHRPIPMVPHLIGPPSHWSPNSSVPHLIGPPISTHASPIPLVSHLIGPPDSLVPHLIGPLLIGPPIHKSPTTYWSPFSLIHPISADPNGPPSHWSPISLVPQLALRTTHSIAPPVIPPSLRLSTLFSLVPHLIGPPMRPWLHSSHWSLISLVPQSNPVYPVLIGSPSHWSPNVILVIQLSLVPHLIGPPL